MARKGKKMELKKHPMIIHKLELKSVDLPKLTVHVECSKGTYIRSLARDLGEELNSGGHLTGLRRTRIGPYTLSDSQSLDNFLEKIKLL